jgi:hypothetical protein
MAQDKTDKSPATEIHAGIFNALLPIGIILCCYSCTFSYSSVPVLSLLMTRFLLSNDSTLNLMEMMLIL